MKMEMLPTILNDTGDCCCQKCPRCNNCDCVPGGDGCICRGDGTGDSIESAITCDLVWTEKQPNGRKKYYKVVSGSSQQNQPVVLPTASLSKRGVVQLTNDLSDREDLALTPKGAKVIKTALDKETAERTAKDSDLQGQIDKEKTDRANADADLLNKINQEKTDRANADKALSDKLDKEITDRKNGDTNLSNSITTINNKVTGAVNKANNAVTSVTSNGNATVTVKKADGTSSSFTINNVAHTASADSATNASHATNADNATHATTADSATKATNADHATVADRLSSGSELDTSSVQFKKYTLSIGQTITSTETSILSTENLGNGNYKYTYRKYFKLFFPYPKLIGNSSDIIVDNINLTFATSGSEWIDISSPSHSGFEILTFGTSASGLFVFSSGKLTTVSSSQLPATGSVIVQGNIVVYIHNRTLIKAD